MFRRIVSRMIIILLLVSCLMLLSSRSVVAWNGTVYIDSYGNVVPPDAPIQKNGIVYTLTGNITSDADGVIVQCDNVVIDGAGYAIQGALAFESKGIDVIQRSNVTIKNVTIEAFDYGIYLANSSGCRIVENVLTYNYYGMWLFTSTYDVIRGNRIASNVMGLGLTLSSIGTSIFHNSFEENSVQGYCDTQSSSNSWDNGYPSGGNYWSDYNGTDSDQDGIGDTPYAVDSENQDNYPLMNPWIQKIGDINFDGRVDVKDVYAVARAYGTSLQGPNPPGRYYNPDCDLNNDYRIDVKDLFIVGKHYGT